MKRTCTFVIGPRCSGKTYFMFEESERTSAIIITSQQIQADLLKLRAKEAGYDIPDPISWETYRESEINWERYQKLDFPEGTRFLIDDVQDLIFEIFGGKVDYAAVLDTLPTIHFN